MVLERLVRLLLVVLERLFVRLFMIWLWGVLVLVLVLVLRMRMVGLMKMGLWLGMRRVHRMLLRGVRLLQVRRSEYMRRRRQHMPRTRGCRRTSRIHTHSCSRSRTHPNTGTYRSWTHTHTHTHT